LYDEYFPKDTWKIPDICMSREILNPPSLPIYDTENGFYSSIESVAPDPNVQFTSFVEEYVDSVNDRIKVTTEVNGKVYQLFYFANNRTSYFLEEEFHNVGARHTVCQFSNNDYFTLLTQIEHNQLRTLNEILMFNSDQQSKELYLGKKTIRGIECNHWRSHMYNIKPDRESKPYNMTIDHYFSDIDWNILRSNRKEIPIRIVIGIHYQEKVTEHFTSVINFFNPCKVA
jgi:hypothetical protein